MASGLYVKGKENLGLKNIDFSGGDIIAILVDTAIYTPDLSIDAVQADIPSSAIIAEQTMTGVSFSNGILDADDLVFQSLFSMSPIGAIVIAQNSGTYATTLLIALIDNDSIPQLPVVPDGTDLTIMWSNGPDKIFAL